MIDRVSGITGISGGPSANDRWGDPEWSLLDDRRGDLPPFPIDALPSRWREWVGRAARRAGVPPDYVILPLLVGPSGLIGTTRLVQASTSWSEPLSMWTAIIGYSGAGKTPGLNVSRRALASVERSREDTVDEMRRKHETRVAKARAAL